jgi:putative sterol carrier protein
MMQLAQWGMRWVRGRMQDDELDVSALMCDVQRRLDPGKFPGGQTVLQFEFTDVDEYADWWVIVSDDDVDLCLEDTGYEVDVLFTGDLRTLTEVWMGDLPIKRALASRKLKVNGAATYLRNLHAWFPLHALSATRPVAE